jgi:hypothetical protein
VSLCLDLLPGIDAPAARAHGRPLAMMSFSRHPGDPNTLVAGTTFGAVLSRDGGDSWQWICEEAIGYEGDRFEARLVVTGDGTLLAVGAGGGLRLSLDGGCSWLDAAGPGGQGLADVAVGGGTPPRIFATTSRFEGDNAVWVSDSGGLTFTRSPLVRPRTFLSSILRLGAGSEDRLRVAGWWFDPPAAWLFASDDGGGTWRQRSLALAAPVYLLAESRSGDLWWRSNDGPALNRLHRSDSEGQGLRAVLEVAGVIRGLAESPDDRVWVASSDGMWLGEEGGARWSRLPRPSKYVCVNGGGGGPVVACGSLVLDGWNAASTEDAGGSWQPLLRFPNIVGPVRCPRSTEAAQCASYWNELAGKLTLDPAVSDGGVTDAADVTDAPAPADRDAGGRAGGAGLARGGGGCSLDPGAGGGAHDGRSPGWGLWLVVVWLGWLRRRPPGTPRG